MQTPLESSGGRWLSFLGLYPLTLFLLAHLTLQNVGIYWPPTYVRVLSWGDGARFVVDLLVLVPFFLHAGLGVRRVMRGNSPLRSVPQKLARFGHALALFALLFVVVHVLTVRFSWRSTTTQPEGVYTFLAGLFSRTQGGIPLRALAYDLGILALSFHVAVGIGGAIRDRTGRGRVAFFAGAALFLLLVVLGANAVTFHASGAPFFGAPGDLLPPPAGCP